MSRTGDHPRFSAERNLKRGISVGVRSRMASRSSDLLNPHQVKPAYRIEMLRYSPPCDQLNGETPVDHGR